MIETPKLPSRLSGLADDFGAQARSIFERFVAPMNRAGPPASIFHYTTKAGLQGILGTGTLWFTDLFSLDDPTELQYGLSHLKGVLERNFSGQILRIREFVPMFEAIFPLNTISRLADYFSCSFSTVDDDLSQWMTYSDHGKGYALEFDGRAFQKVFVLVAGRYAGANFANFPVDYRQEVLEFWLSELVDAMLVSFRQSKGYYPGKVQQKFMLELGAHLATWAPFIALGFKYPKFETQNEYRFLQMYLRNQRPSDIHIRVQDGKSVKYRKLHWLSSTVPILKSVTIGPGLDPGTSSAFVSHCLRERELNEVSIHSSNIPWRR